MEQAKRQFGPVATHGERVNTSLRLPKKMLLAYGKEARKRGITRNALIIEVLMGGQAAFGK